MTNAEKILTLIAEGYYVRSDDDRYITCENPNYRPDDGSDPYIVYDIHEHFSTNPTVFGRIQI